MSDYTTQYQDYNNTHDNSIPQPYHHTIPMANTVYQQAVPNTETSRNMFQTTLPHAQPVFNITPPKSKKKSPKHTFWENQQNVSKNPTANNTTPPNNNNTDTFMLHNKQNDKTLAHFVNQTLNYVFAQLCVTAAVTAAMYVHKTTVNNYIVNHTGIIWVPIILTFTSLIGMFCCSNKKTEPLKKGLFCLFTLACSMMVGISAIQYAPDVILNASITLLVMVGFINVYAYNSAKQGTDLSFMGPSLMGILLIIITLGILNIFIQSSMLNLCIAGISVIVFSLLLIYDLNRLYNGREQDDYDHPDPLIAAINIYLDIINIFINLLQIFGGNSN